MGVDAVVRGDGFPNAEVLLVDSTGQVAPLLDYRTKSNFAGPFHRLMGTNEDYVLAKFKIDIPFLPSGVFGGGTMPKPHVVDEK